MSAVATRVEVEAVCRLCGAAGLELRFRNERAPRNVSRLLRDGETDEPVEIRVCSCRACGPSSSTPTPRPATTRTT